jgi:hypothetical protein
MTAREVHFLTCIPRSNMNLVPRLLRLGKNTSLKLARIVTANADLDVSDRISCRDGDVLIELVGLLSTNQRGFVDATVALDSRIQIEVLPGNAIAVIVA